MFHTGILVTGLPNMNTEGEEPVICPPPTIFGKEIKLNKEENVPKLQAFSEVIFYPILHNLR
jgi:hypothetical protein